MVTRRSAGLRCDLATRPCTELEGPTAVTGVVACVGEIFALDGTCRTDAASRAPVFDDFTALPPPDDFRAMVEQPSTTEVRLTTDAFGILLVPMDYAARLLRIGNVPIPQLARFSTATPAFAGSPATPVQLPGDAFRGSFSPEGIRLPPIFTPIADPSDPTALTLFGSVDAPRGVVRLARRGCVGGAATGAPCTADAQCPGAVCSAPLFDFSDRYASGAGPVILSGTAGQYTAAIEDPVPLEGLIQGQDTFTFVVSESADGTDRNADADALDLVVTLRDRDSGVLQPIGEAGSEGRATRLLSTPPLLAAAVETRGTVVTFLESEFAQGGQDLSGNGELSDQVLRVFSLGAGTATELTVPTRPPTADAGLRFGGAPLALADGAALFVAAEAALAAQTTVQVSLDTGGAEANADSGATGCNLLRSLSLSRNGRFVAFESAATNLVPGDTNGATDVFVRDRDADGNGLFDEPGGVDTRRIGVDGLGNELATGSTSPRLSDDRRFAAFRAPNTLGTGEVFLHDLAAASSSFVSSSAGRVDDLSPTSRFVLYNRLVFLTFGGSVPFLTDTTGGGTLWILKALDGTLLNANSTGGGVSRDGRFVAFTLFGSDAGTLLGPADFNGFAVVFVRLNDPDRNGILEDVPGGFAFELISVDAGGGPANGPSFGADLSQDGRFVVFASEATNLVPGDDNATCDVFVRDTVSGDTRRASLTAGGSEAEGFGAAISADGRTAAFTGRLPATNGFVHAFVRGSDPADPGADRSGDGTADDAVLRVLDTGAGAPTSPLDLCPADAVAARADGAAVFLRPEAAGASSAAACTGASLFGPDLNGDGDALDAVVHFFDGTAVTNLRCVASAVALSASRLAALVSEAGEGADLNGDGDAVDGVAQLVDGTTGAPAPFVDALGAPRAAVSVREFVVGTRLAALRVNEAAEGDRS